MVLVDLMTADMGYFYPCSSVSANTYEQLYFKPDTMLMNPHWLNYQKAHVEFTIDTKRWYLMGAPLMGVVAGDMYTTSSTGKLFSNSFKGITYDINVNNPFAPSLYQRVCYHG